MARTAENDYDVDQFVVSKLDSNMPGERFSNETAMLDVLNREHSRGSISRLLLWGGLGLFGFSMLLGWPAVLPPVAAVAALVGYVFEPKSQQQETIAH